MRKIFLKMMKLNPNNTMTTREQVWWDAFKIYADIHPSIKEWKAGITGIQKTIEKADYALAEFDKRFAKREEGQNENQPCETEGGWQRAANVIISPMNTNNTEPAA